jgi:hypothetical protein
MVTKDLEKWLERADIPIEEATTLDRYLDYLEENLGIHGGSLKVAEKIFGERYELWDVVGIRAIERHYTVRGEPFVETRYGIAGKPGLWGREKMLDIAEERAWEMGLEEFALRIRAIRQEEFG